MAGVSTHLYEIAPVPLQNVLVSIQGAILYRQRYANPVFWSALRFLEASSEMSLSELKEYQTSELRMLVDHSVSSVPFYRDLFATLGINSRDIMSDYDLSMLPVLNKATVKANLARMLSSTYGSRQLIPVSTSGTTGTALRFWWTREGAAKEFAFVWARRRPGVTMNQPFATFNGRRVCPLSQKRPPYWRENRILRQTLFSIFHMREDTLDQYLEQLDKGRYGYYAGYPSAIYTVAAYALAKGWHPKRPPAAVFTSSETLTDWQRVAIEKAFRTRVIDSYTNGEQSVLMFQCEFGYYHISYEYSIVELQEIADIGEAVICKVLGTGFLNLAMPLIRYDTGDCVEVLKDQTQCPCGRPGPIIRRIHGREEDMVITPDGRIVGRLYHVFTDMVNVRESQVVQRPDGGLDVLIVPLPGYSVSEERQLISRLREKLGNTIDIRIRHVNEIPRTSGGKFRAVISHFRPDKGWLKTTYE